LYPEFFIQNEGAGVLYKLKTSWTCPVATCVFLLLAAAAMAQPAPSDLVNGLRWRLLGPFRGGRAVAVSGVPGDSTTFYFGAVDGGIWKTIDAGVMWTPIFDGQPVASIGALVVAPSDPKTIYAGTGESDIREDLSTGTGNISAWNKRGRSAGLRLIPRMPILSMWVLWVMLTVRTAIAAFTNRSMEERTGRGFSTWERT
jgi:hypothetical protein